MNELPTTSTPISVLLADAHAVCRAGVRSMLDESEFVIVEEVQTARAMLEAVRRLHSQLQLVLLDIRLIGGGGLNALQVLKTEFPAVPVVILTLYDNPIYVARAVTGGAAGYLLKGVEREDLLESLRAVVRGDTLFHPQDLNRVLREIRQGAVGAPDLIRPLSPREAEVLRLLGTGLSNHDIARVLVIAECTVKTHIEHIIQKLGVADKLQAAVWAARHGMTEDD